MTKDQFRADKILTRNVQRKISARTSTRLLSILHWRYIIFFKYIYRYRSCLDLVRKMQMSSILCARMSASNTSRTLAWYLKC